MEYRIEQLESTTIAGKNLEMSLADDRTRELWQSFGPHVKNIHNRKDQNLISLQIFDQSFDPNNFDPSTPFTKWAAAAIRPDYTDQSGQNQKERPVLDEHFIEGGLYVVFKHKGPASEFRSSMEYIYGVWFPNHPFELDDREHFEILPPGYRPDDPGSEEEIWIPIRKK